MMATLLNWLGSGRSPAPPARRVLTAQVWPSAVYAVGDIHGCLDELRSLENKIVEDGASFPGPKWIVYLGDYVDRGPDSAGVLDHVLSRAPADFTRFCLAGNHETMMLDFLDNAAGSSTWLDYGGDATLQSYGIDFDRFQRASRRGRADILESSIPGEHRAFLAECALALSLPGATFVHAGLKPGRPLDQQQESDLLWIRQEFLNAEWPADQLIIHGHTPAEEPLVAPGRIGIDTGAFATGRLTSVRLTQSLQPQFVHAARRHDPAPLGSAAHM